MKHALIKSSIVSGLLLFGFAASLRIGTITGPIGMRRVGGATCSKEFEKISI